MNKVIDYNYYLNMGSWYFFKNFGPLPNFEKSEASHFKFGTQTDHGNF